ncbi:hypothetical protein TARUN_9549 [Trichoderma arundinaceum]|uniref:Uncharacterized protein n=1 Tax=Trichoderma arundinaceum TaxID=490622 RepID=A0A395N9B3_TRIAR|nr:hypothetical protein TARUN_9549 [Trichoderma arundinaceum]
MILAAAGSGRAIPSAAAPTHASKLEGVQRCTTSRLEPSTSIPVQDWRLVNGTMDGSSPHVPYDAAGIPPPSAATSEAQWIRLCIAAPSACRVGRETGGLVLTELVALRRRAPLLGSKHQRPIGSRLEGPPMLRYCARSQPPALIVLGTFGQKQHVRASCHSAASARNG